MKRTGVQERYDMCPHRLFSIGHTTHSIDVFVAMLKKWAVTAIADVRSQPYSRRMEHFNRENLATCLEAVGINYVFMGKELGARRVEAECYEGEQAAYHKIAGLSIFRDGLERIRRGAHQHRIALMCAEGEPLDCHRTILVCREVRDEFQIGHILSDGTLEDHQLTEKRLVRKMNVTPTLFEPQLSNEQLIQRAYDKRAQQIAYRTNQEGAAH